jgi:antitoxin component of MazEF toxin-antitoxin module
VQTSKYAIGAKSIPKRCSHACATENLCPSETDVETAAASVPAGEQAVEQQSVGKTPRWISFITSFIMSGMTKRLQAIGNSSGIIIDRAILDLLGITQETDLDLETDGKRLIITPVQGDDRRKRLAKVQSRALRNHAEKFRKLAK